MDAISAIVLLSKVAAWTFVALVLTTFVVETAFMQVSSAKRALAMGVYVPWDVKAVSYCWLAVGLPADAVFNLTRGSIIFREWPHFTWQQVWRITLPIPELLFTSRVKRHWRTSTGWRYDTADKWAGFLNAVDDAEGGHIRRT